MDWILLDKITWERVVNKRGPKLYLDYLQLWKMRTMPAPYSARALPGATVSAPVSWDEVETGFHPSDFTILTVRDRLRQKGDIFSRVTTDKDDHRQNLAEILAFIERHGR